jgi:hypothetical protein
MRQAGQRTRPELLVWCGAPRRNRTGDPILTMEPPGTAVRTAVSPGHARPSGPKLSVLFRHSYALSSSLVLIVAGASHHPRSEIPNSVDRPRLIIARVHATLGMVAFDVVDQFVSPLQHPAAHRLLPAEQTLSEALWRHRADPTDDYRASRPIFGPCCTDPSMPLIRRHNTLRPLS